MKKSMRKMEKLSPVALMGLVFLTLAMMWLELIDDLTTDQWGGAGPDCCTMPASTGF